MLVAEAVGQTLVQQGVRQVFGLIGSGNFAVSNALVEAGASFVATRHEGGAITMTDAYTRVTGTPAVCSVHQGPGLTNTMTGLTEAAKGRTPLLVLAADTPAAALRSNFRIEQDQLVRSVGAVPVRLASAETAAAETARAVRQAQLERRPVVLMLPIDVGALPAPPLKAGALGRLEAEPPRPAPYAVDEVVELLLRAKRPLIVAGRGAALANARAELEKLAESVGALLATSAVANGLFAGNPWALGISGGFASPIAAELIAQADLVLGMGVALNMWTTRHGRLIDLSATVVQVDIDPEAIGAHHRVDLGVVGDVSQTVCALIDALPSSDRIGPGWRSPELKARIEAGRWERVPYADAGDERYIDPRTLSIELDRMLPTERTVAVDSGHFMGYPSMYLRVPDAAGFVFTQAYQAIGLGLATAIGAAVARPDRLTVAALGDGGALMGVSELETVARLGLPMLIVVYDDAAYGAEVHHFASSGAPLDLVRFPDADIAAIARGFGLEGVVVRRPTDLEAVRTWLARPSRPALLVDAKVVPSVVAEWLEEAFGH